MQGFEAVQKHQYFSDQSLDRALYINKINVTLKSNSFPMGTITLTKISVYKLTVNSINYLKV